MELEVDEAIKLREVPSPKPLSNNQAPTPKVSNFNIHLDELLMDDDDTPPSTTTHLKENADNQLASKEKEGQERIIDLNEWVRGHVQGTSGGFIHVNISTSFQFFPISVGCYINLY